mgnify:FL=1
MDQEAPSSLRNSAQGLIAFATYGVGKLLGTIVAGNVVDHYSEGGAYNWVSIWTIPFALAIFFLIGFVLLFREKRR